MSSWPLTTVLIRLLWLRALCSVAEGATTAVTVIVDGPAQCIAAVLNDAQKRLCILGGRDGMPWSLGSVLGSFVTRFLGGFRGRESHRIQTPGIRSRANGVAVTRDGTALLVSDDDGGSHGVHVFCVATGGHVRTIGCIGDGPLQFWHPCQVCIAPDDFVFVADCGNDRIHILTPGFDFHGFVGKGQLESPAGVCANSDIIAVSETFGCHISVFSRADGAFLRRFGIRGSGDGELGWPRGLCFFNKRSCCIAAAEVGGHRISMLHADGEFVCTVGGGELMSPIGVAGSHSGDELIVADYSNRRVVVFSAGNGEVLHAIGAGEFTGVAVHHGTIFAQNFDKEVCVVFT